MVKLRFLFTIIRRNGIAVMSAMILLIFAQQLHINQVYTVEVDEASASSNESEDAEKEPLKLQSFDQNIIASNIQINVNHVFYEIMNIELDEQEDGIEHISIISYPDGYRKVLFRQVISPNAP